MAKKTGWDALPKKYREGDPKTGECPLVLKRLLVKHGLWEENVAEIFLSGFEDDEIRECFEEYGCTEEEIDGYFLQYEPEPLAMGAAVGR
jgi:hypothetical protein